MPQAAAGSHASPAALAPCTLESWPVCANPSTQLQLAAGSCQTLACQVQLTRAPAACELQVQLQALLEARRTVR